MSSEYFFSKWINTLNALNIILDNDRYLQDSNAHDKTLCEASERLSSMLARYINIFNDALDCKIHNVQVQKIPYLEKVVIAISDRILELKQELRKLHSSNYQYLANSLKSCQLTPYDVEFIGIPEDAPRPDAKNEKLREIFQVVKEDKERIILEQQKSEVKTEKKDFWWETESEEDVDEGGKKEELTEEQLKTREMAALIQGHERSRQVIFDNRKKKLFRERWIKELNGIMPPPPRLELRVRAAKLIQMACRIYFEKKRKRIESCRRDQMLGIQYCDCPKLQKTINSSSDELKARRVLMRNKYMKNLEILYQNVKQNYLKKKETELKEYYRDIVRDWFFSWFHEIQYFHDIPNEKKGGIVAIIKDETPAPTDWLEECIKAVEKENANKEKTAQELKAAAQEAKYQKKMLKKEEQLKAKQQANLMKKLMKSPAHHPGFTYPKSRKMLRIIEAMEEYHKHWDDLDDTGTKYVKERFIRDLNFANACAEVKMEVANYVVDDMNKELKLLKTALKEDYASIGEKMMEPPQKKVKKGKKKQTQNRRAELTAQIVEELRSLAMQDIFKEYPRTALEDFLGDHNLNGDDIRCNFGQPFPYPGETRSLWWERCCEVVRGSRKVLIAGPKGSGKTKLVHAMASLNDATLFEIDPCETAKDLTSAVYLQQLVASITTCAQETQPAIICLRNIHRFYYSKTPPEFAEVNTALLETYFVTKLCKMLKRTSNVTVIGICEDPWLTNAKLPKHFPVVVPMPGTAYSTVHKLLYDWVTNNRTVPNDLDIQSLARMLQGYTFGYIKERLQKYLDSERIVHIAAYGLKPQEIYNYFLEEDMGKIEYDKYWQWYFNKTTWGRKEKQHFLDQLEYKAALEKYEAKQKKKAKATSAGSSKIAMKS